MVAGHYDRAAAFASQPPVACPGCGVDFPMSATRSVHFRVCGTLCTIDGCDQIKLRKRYRCSKHQAIHDRCRKFGITLERYYELWDQCNGKCSGCLRTLEMHGSGASKDAVVHIDHDENTGYVRGFLCHSCNLGIGYLHHDIATIERLLAYLRNDK